MAGDHGVGDPPSGLCPVLYRIGKCPFKGMRLQSNYASGSRGNAPKPGNFIVRDGESQETHAVEDATQRSRSTAPCASQDVRSVSVPLHCTRRHTSEKRYDSSARTRSVNRIFVNRKDAAFAPHALALGLFDTERMSTCHPGQCFFKDALRQVPDRTIRLTTPADWTFIDNVEELPFALLDVRRLIAEAVEGCAVALRTIFIFIVIGMSFIARSAIPRSGPNSFSPRLNA